MKKTIKVGIIGTGKHGSRYANHIINDLPEFQLTAICRRSGHGRKQAKTWKVNYYSDCNDLIEAPEVEAIISVTPPHLNLHIAKECVRARKPLLIEKPLAINKAEAKKIVSLFQDADIALTVGQTLRYNQVIQGLKKELSQIGTLLSFSANHRLEPVDMTWEDDKQQSGSGVVFQTAVHLFDAVRYITGKEIARVRASIFKHNNAKLENLFTAQLELSDGVPGLVDASKICPARAGRYEFIGSKGQLQGDQIHDVLEFIKGIDTTNIETEIASPAILPLLRDWHNFLHGNSPNPIPGNEGLAAVKVCHACLDSAREDRWVEV